MRAFKRPKYSVYGTIQHQIHDILKGPVARHKNKRFLLCSSVFADKTKEEPKKPLGDNPSAAAMDEYNNNRHTELLVYDKENVDLVGKILAKAKREAEYAALVEAVAKCHISGDGDAPEPQKPGPSDADA